MSQVPNYETPKMERLFEDGCYTSKAMHIESQAEQMLLALAERYPEVDYRDLSHILNLAAFDTGLRVALNRKFR